MRQDLVATMDCDCHHDHALPGIALLVGAPPMKPHRPWYQFSLRTMFVLTMLVAVGSAVGPLVYREWRLCQDRQIFFRFMEFEARRPRCGVEAFAERERMEREEAQKTPTP